MSGVQCAHGGNQADRPSLSAGRPQYVSQGLTSDDYLRLCRLVRVHDGFLIRHEGSLAMAMVRNFP
jgi:hypothetical protein